MNSYTDLKAELTNDPAKLGYAGMTDAQASTAINTANITVTVDVPIGGIGGLFDALLKLGVWGPICTAASGAASAAQEAAQSIVSIIDNQRLDTVQMSDAATAQAVATQLGALVSASVLTQAQATSIEGLSQAKTSRASIIGWPLGVSDLDVHAARA